MIETILMIIIKILIGIILISLMLVVLKLVIDMLKLNRKYGVWIENDNGTYSCSLCSNCSCKKTKFCPNCGADMRGKHNE